PLGHEIGLAGEERYGLMESKRKQRDAIIEFARTHSVRPELVNEYFRQHEISPLRQSVKLHDLILRPQLSIETLRQLLPEFDTFLKDNVEADRFDEIIEAAEILIKYNGYIERERQIADKIHRLEDIKLRGKIDYDSVNSISTEARQKLKRINPETIAQASRIPGISPSDINILLLMLGR
ncbi:MAG: tRNA uridine-5-carboxymethylaminomethyl(34) synthesis enzyme MnmG, partial [Paramuribaculum sp.]|nr:tRNA uridine-5-carboxymethylaminomethyl(34) synthesis enzyme MnmG [Paramuribaculum sp.]